MGWHGRAAPFWEPRVFVPGGPGRNATHVRVLVDPVHYFLHSLTVDRATRHVGALVPELLLLGQEVEARHEALEAGCAGIEAVSFACVQQVVETWAGTARGAGHLAKAGPDGLGAALTL